MSNPFSPVTPAMPSFADLQAQMGQQSQQPSASTSGVQTLPAPVATPGGQGFTPPAPQAPPVQPQESYLTQLERMGKVPAGQFKTERELIDALYSTAEDLANRVNPEPLAQPVAKPPVPETPVVNQADLSKAATMFQQQGWLAMNNGQWVATNPIAQGAAQQLNTAMLEAQARQAELADPTAFITKYGQSAIDSRLTPLQQELQQLRQENQAIQARLAETLPRPDKQFVEANKDKLWTTDPAGTRVPTQAGKLYSQAWDMASKAGYEDFNQIHEYALSVAQPYLQPTPQPAQPQHQPWMQQVQNSPVTDPSFTAPGTVFTNSVPPSGIGIPVGNDGFPTFGSLQALGIQGR